MKNFECQKKPNTLTRSITERKTIKLDTNRLIQDSVASSKDCESSDNDKIETFRKEIEAFGKMNGIN